ncbi:spore coat protein [Collibacillus ludicampi]|uniref:Spore coat protein n=1 Tax=Collibacillus ludicampi TaxID=2771369 RepID=A0AAV4LHF1_9BACL|nr:phosphotransferase [Collibacillus ludicampi]GIM47205.1 spore coat protein [Collibacillus ludicampi]
MELNEFLNKILEHEYHITVSGTVRMRSVVGILSEQGAFVLKKIEGYPSMNRITQLAEVLEKLQEKDVPVAPLLRTRKGKAFVRIGDLFWIVQPWIKGHHCDFSNKEERLASVRSIARMHQTPVALPAPSQNYLWTPPLDEKYGARLERCKRILHAERLPIKISSLWIKEAESAIVRLQGNDYKQALKKDRERGTVCHRDLAPHNLIYKDRTAYLIDFDIAGIDVRAHDLYQVINHALFLNGWCERTVADILRTYQKVAPLCEANHKLLRTLFTYPALLLREVYEYRKEKERDSDKWRTRLEWTLAIEEQRREWIHKGGF